MASLSQRRGPLFTHMAYEEKSNTERKNAKKKTKNETAEARGGKGKRNQRRAAQFFKNKEKHNRRAKMPKKKQRAKLQWRASAAFLATHHRCLEGR